jgi:hypothetical protein
MGIFVDENDVGHWQRQQSKRTGGVHYIVRSLVALVSWGLTMSQNEPKRIPKIPQNMPIVIVDTILKFISKLDDIVISSGFAGNTTKAKAMITA